MGGTEEERGAEAGAEGNKLKAIFNGATGTVRTWPDGRAPK